MNKILDKIISIKNVLLKKDSIIIDTIQFIIIIVCIISFIISAINKEYNGMNVSIFIIFLNNIYYSFRSIKTRIFFFFLHLAFFGFLISRPIISMFRGDEWWYFREQSLLFALISMISSLVCMFLGAYFYEKVVNKFIIKKKIKELDETEQNKRDVFLKTLQKVALVLFIICITFSIVRELDRYIFMQDKTYIDLYTDYTTVLPVFIRVPADMSLVILCIYLSTKPNKKITIFVMLLYIVSGIFPLLVGLRGQMVSKLFFVFLYFFIRNVYDEKTKWIGIIEKTIMLVSIPILIIGLSIMNYTREDKDVPNKGIGYTFTDFFYKQGVTFDVLCMGYKVIDNLPNKNEKMFTLGPIIDYIKYSTISQTFFGTEDFN